MADSPLCDIVLLNDDFTPMEFVVSVLEDVFDLPNPEAVSLMLRVHHEGRAVCGTYPPEEAGKKAAELRAFAAEHKHPLQCVVEAAPWLFSLPRHASALGYRGGDALMHCRYCKTFAMHL
jgi:ATP-dependent Clp protease adaptor protein ClpS